jgi:hypothetical protein
LGAVALQQNPISLGGFLVQMRFVAALTLACLITPSRVAGQVPLYQCAASAMRGYGTQYFRRDSNGYDSLYTPRPSERDSLVRSLARDYMFVEVGTEGGPRYAMAATAIVRVNLDEKWYPGRVEVTGVRRAFGVTSSIVSGPPFKMILSAGGSPAVISLEDEEFAGSDAGRVYHVTEYASNGVLRGRWERTVDRTTHLLELLHGIELTETPQGYFCLLPKK